MKHQLLIIVFICLQGFSSLAYSQSYTEVQHQQQINWNSSFDLTTDFPRHYASIISLFNKHSNQYNAISKDNFDLSGFEDDLFLSWKDIAVFYFNRGVMLPEIKINPEEFSNEERAFVTDLIGWSDENPLKKNELPVETNKRRHLQQLYRAIL